MTNPATSPGEEVFAKKKLLPGEKKKGNGVPKKKEPTNWEIQFDREKANTWERGPCERFAIETRGSALGLGERKESQKRPPRI